jgi:hypothetical protein
MTTKLDIAAIEARCEAATEYPADEGLCSKCGQGVYVRPGLEWNDGDWCDDCLSELARSARADIPALVARIEELETIVRLHLTECAHCGCSLYLPDGPPHCHDCLVDEDDETRWNEARAALGEEKP